MVHWKRRVLCLGLLIAGAFVSVEAKTRQVQVFPLDIKFETNKANITQDTQNDGEFLKLTQELKNYPYAKVEIEGYADATGPETWNQKLSEMRAETVRQRFVDKYGITPDRIKAVGYGENKPLATNNTAA